MLGLGSARNCPQRDNTELDFYFYFLGQSTGLNLRIVPSKPMSFFFNNKKLKMLPSKPMSGVKVCNLGFDGNLKYQ